MAWQVDDEALAEHVRRIISTIDLASCTKKDIMALLEGAVLGGGAGGAATPAALASALADKKDFISKTIDDVLMARIVSEEDERLARQLQQEETTPLTRSRSGSKASPRAPRKRRAAKGAAPLQLPTGMTLIASGFNRPLKLSKALAALFGGTVTHLSRPQVVKRIWQYVKENGLQDESNRRIIICDELLKAVFRAGRVDCFQMNKVLSSHLFPDKNYDPTATDAPIDSAEEEEGAPALDKSSSLVNDDDDSFGNDAERPAAPKIGRASRPLAEGEASSSPQPAPFTIPRQLSRIIPAERNCREYRQAQEAAMAYVQERTLFDPKSPTTIRLDDALREALWLASDGSDPAAGSKLPPSMETVTIFDFVDRVRSILYSVNKC